MKLSAFIFTLSLSLMILTNAQEAEKTASPAADTKEGVKRVQGMDLSDVKSFEAAKMKVILRSTPAFQDIVAFQVSAYGGINLTDQAGLLQMMLSALGRGTPSYSKDQIDQIFTESGAIFSMEPRADSVEVSLKCLRRYLPKLLAVISEMIRVPLMKPEEVELIRKQMLAELKSEKDHPDSVLQLLAHKAYYKGHPYFNRANGYLETIEGFKRDQLLEFLPKVFNKKNLIFSVVGDISETEVSEMIQTFFGKVPDEGTKGEITSAAPKPDRSKVHFEKFDAPTTYFTAVFKAPSLTEDEYPALVLASQILDNRLFEEVRTKRGLTYAVHSSIGMQNVNLGSLYVSSTTLDEAVKVMFDEVEKMKTEKIDDKTLELQVRKFTANWFLGRETSSSQAKIFALYETLGKGWKFSNTFIDRLSQVTPDQVQQAAKKYFTDYLFAVVGPNNIDLKGKIPSGSAGKAVASKSGKSPAASATKAKAAKNKAKPSAGAKKAKSKADAKLKNSKQAAPAKDQPITPVDSPSSKKDEAAASTPPATQLKPEEPKPAQVPSTGSESSPETATPIAK